LSGPAAEADHGELGSAPHLDEDAVFGVKPSLIQEFKRKADGKGYTPNYDFGLSPTA
jgi:hypothetical protein